MKFNIIIGGSLGYSGGGTLMDLIREVDTYYVTPQEFRLFTDPDGLLSLESALVDNWNIFQSDLALKRFKKLCYNLNRKFHSPYSTLGYSKYFGDSFINSTNNYINELVDFKYMGLWYGIDTYIQRKLNKFKIFQRSSITTKNIFISSNISEIEFIDITKKFVLKLFEDLLLKYEKINIAIDEGNVAFNATRIFRYLPQSSKIIVIIRNPLDIYSQMKVSGAMFIPEEIGDFIKYQKALYKRLEQQKKEVANDRFLIIRFEDLVLKYDDSVNTIFTFLNIDHKLHSRKKTIFIPEVSKRNIGLWKNNLCEKEINIINKDLISTIKEYYYEYVA